LGEIVGGFEGKRVLLERVLSLGERLASLVGELAVPEVGEEFDRLLLERQDCLAQFDELDRLVPANAGYSEEQAARVAELLAGIDAATKQLIGSLTLESQALKQQMENHHLRRKGLLTYGTNVLAKKSMILDESQ